MKWKTGLIKCLVHRAYKVCSDKNLLRNEIDHLRHLFFKNGYPTKLFDRVTDEYFEEEEKKKNHQSSGEIIDQPRTQEEED